MNANGTPNTGFDSYPGVEVTQCRRGRYLRSSLLICVHLRFPLLRPRGQTCGIGEGVPADARSAMKLRRTPDRSAIAHRLVGVARHKPDHRCSIVLSTQPLK